MNILAEQILGAGSVGHLLACRFHLAGKCCQLIGRGDSDYNDKVVYKQGKTNQPVSLDYWQMNDVKVIRRLWVTVKSYHLAEALQSVALKLSNESQVILLCNGMGNLELARSILPACQLYVGVNTHGCYYQHNSHTLHHTGLGEIVIGQDYLDSGSEHEVLDIASLASSQLNLRWSEDIQPLLWQKLGINAVINPLTALHQCPNGDLLTRPELRQLTEQLIEELMVFFQAIKLPELARSFRDICHQVIRQTAANYSSMMLDVKNNRNTEIESISGYLLSHANGVRLTLEGHQKLYQKFQKH